VLLLASVELAVGLAWSDDLLPLRGAPHPARRRLEDWLMPFPSMAEIVRRHNAAGIPLTPAELSYLTLMHDGLWHSPEEQHRAGGKRYDARRWDLDKKYGYEFDHDEREPDVYWWRLVGKRTQPVRELSVRRVKRVSTGGQSWEEAIAV
jgi:hypothetical protein